MVFTGSQDHKVYAFGSINPDLTLPVADAGPDQTVDEDTQVILDGSGSWDNIGITNYTWTFTDVTPQILTSTDLSSLQYNFSTPGVYNITLIVTDAAANWKTDTVVITVLDVTDPMANAGSDQTVKVNTQIAFDADESSDNVGIVNYEWNFGEGTTETSVTTTHTYTEAGTYTVTLIVIDEAGNSDTDTIIITVQEESGFPWVTVGIGAAVVAIVIISAVYLLVKRKIIKLDRSFGFGFAHAIGLYVIYRILKKNSKD
jgi:PKD repeat protein